MDFVKDVVLQAIFPLGDHAQQISPQRFIACMMGLVAFMAKGNEVDGQIEPPGPAHSSGEEVMGLEAGLAGALAPFTLWLPLELLQQVLVCVLHKPILGVRTCP